MSTVPTFSPPPDPGPLELCAVTAAARAQELRARAARLGLLAQTCRWAGPAARAFRARTATVVVLLRRAAEELEDSADQWRRAAGQARAALDHPREHR